MYFKKLELIGFKSFAEKTALQFEPGVTAIVGPNGCGKSNILDGIKWVLGEQSPKSMRSSRMEDVIFNGTSDSEPTNLAEVSLTVSNHTKLLPIDYEEVTVTRRLFRSGESEYLLNKTQVRLKDIIDLFMNTGIGVNAYSLVEQGKIDLILSSKPEERRFVFEEASGIAGFKSKKKEALQKLEQTENNLLRVSDIINEVKRQIGSVERQANKARRYKEEFEKLKNLELSYAKQELRKIKSEADESNELSVKAKERGETLINEINRLELESKEVNLKREETEAKLSEFHLKSLDLSSRAERDKNRISLNKERIAELESKRTNLNEEIKLLSRRLSSKKEQLENLKGESDSLKDSRGSKEERLREKEKLLAEIANSTKEAEGQILNCKARLVDIATEQAKVRSELAKISVSAQTSSARQRRLRLEKDNVLKELTGAEEKLSAIIAEVEHYRSTINGINDRIKEDKSQLALAEDELLNLNAKLQDLQNQLLTLESQLEFLEDLKKRYEGISKSTKAILLTDELPDKKPSWLIAKAKAVEPIAPEPKYEALLASADLKNKFQIIPCEAKFISLESEELRKEIESIKTELSHTSGNIEAKNDSINSIKGRMLQLQADLHNEELALANKETTKAAVESEKKKLSEEVSVVELESAEIESELSELKSKEDSLKKKLLDIEADETQTQNLISTADELISSNAQKKEEALVLITQLKTQLSSLEETLTTQDATLQMLQNSLDEEIKTHQLRAKEIEDSLKRQKELEEESLKLESEINKFLGERELIEKDSLELKSKRDALLSSLSELQKKIAAEKEELDKIKDEANTYQMKNLDLSFKEKSIRERIAQAYKLELGALDSLSTEAEETENLEEAIGQITRLKNRLESMGIVNLAALEEQKELQERFAFLTQQQTDLLEAKDSLLKAIKKIDKTARELFLETFQKLQVEFKNFFRLLFGSGEAELILVDEKDVLESGIEIIARPPGKRLQNLSLLSGGEKALTAIALLFAILKVKPSPFCVLDEVDAPLDESNVDRFSHALKELTKDSQFIIITHNKKTITMSDVMYGITMERSGVSKIVSVKFAEAKVEVHPR